MKKLTPLLTALLSFLLGSLWYSNYFLGSIWQKAVGFQPSAKEIAFPMIASFVMMVIMAYAKS